MEKRILVISNNPLSEDSNNGITMSNLLKHISIDKISNLYFSNSLPITASANSYYRITNKDVILFGWLRNIGYQLQINSTSDNAINNRTKSVKKTAFKQLIREFFWRISRWKNKRLLKWLNGINPNIIILQIGDSCFPILIAKKISEILNNIPIIIYNSENYYFKTFDYFRRKTKPSFYYSIFIKKLKYHYNLIGEKAIWIHLTDEISSKYKNIFQKTSHFVIRNTPNIRTFNYRKENGRFNVYYFGNLSLGRFDTLLSFANTLKETVSTSNLFIYSKCTEDQIKIFNNHKYIHYLGFKNIKEIYSEIEFKCDLLVHIESFDDFAKEDLIDAFSTKIVDCLNSGIPFILFAPSQLNCFKYLKQHNACYLANNRESLAIELSKIKCRSFDEIKNNALKLISNNHNRHKNEIILNKIFNDLDSSTN